MNTKNSRAGSASPLPCDQIVLAAVNARREQLETIFELVLQRIDEAFEARHLIEQRTARNRSTSIQNVGPDHGVRLTAVKLLLRIMTAGRPVPQAPPWVKREPTLEDLKRRWAEWQENHNWSEDSE